MSKLVLVKKIILIFLTLAILSVTVYAWAYINNKVKIDGVQVKPSASEGIYISKSENGSFSAVVTASATNSKSLKAVSTANLVDWFVPANSLNISSGGAYTSDFMEIEEGRASEYYFRETFYVKSTEGNGGLKVTGINVKNPDGTAPDKNISKALRVGIKIGSRGEAFIFAPVDGYDSGYSAVVDGYGSASSQNIVKMLNTEVIPAMQANEANMITVFVWYEGQDSNYNAANLADSEDLVISIEFDAIPQN